MRADCVKLCGNPASAWRLGHTVSTFAFSALPRRQCHSCAWQRHVRQALPEDKTLQKYKVIFLGTPEFAASVLKDLLVASQAPNSIFQVAAVVAKPSKSRVRNKIIKSPVELVAREFGLEHDQILLPDSAKEAGFLSRMGEFAPDLCVTAAYGNMLPQALLDLPRCGTLNIHPSLLPKYRGAAPVPRALLDGATETGVSLAFSVLRCDAGPVLAQTKVAVDGDVQAPELLHHLFGLGSEMLLERLPCILSGEAKQLAQPQDDSLATHAPKLSRDDSQLHFSRDTAQQLHNQVRALAGWPGTYALLTAYDPVTAASEELKVGVLRTRLGPASPAKAQALSQAPGGCGFAGDALLVSCAGGSVLELLEVQPMARKPMAAKDFKNGLRGKQLVLPEQLAAMTLAVAATT